MNAQKVLRAIAKFAPCAKILNVCGGHERVIAQAGLRTALPTGLTLIPGPGCPVCVCPQQDIFAAIHIALEHPVILAAFGDMLRVPVNGPKDQPRSLDQARVLGADIRPIASPLEALHLAQTHPRQQVVFFAAGFETTMAPVAGMMAQGMPDNLLLLLSGRLTWPIIDKLLQEGAAFDALIAPGHVAAIMGAQQWQFVAQTYHLPVAVAGFTPELLLVALYALLGQRQAGYATVDNCYPQVVRMAGNIGAQAILQRTMQVVDAPWRGIGVVAKSGFALAKAYTAHDARTHFPASFSVVAPHREEMPPGCQCAAVILGKITPTACPLYGKPCTPRTPFGPCMVSDEGACRIWWTTGV